MPPANSLDSIGACCAMDCRSLICDPAAEHVSAHYITQKLYFNTCPHKSPEQQPVMSINVCALLIRPACAPFCLSFCALSIANMFMIKLADGRGPACSCILHHCGDLLSHVVTVMISMFCLQVTFPFTTKPEGAGTERVQSCQGAVQQIVI